MANRPILLAVVFAAVAALAVVVGPTPGGADVVHDSCAAVTVGGSSGWCGLYPGNAVNNIRELGMVTVSSDDTSIVVQTQSASTGVDPRTSFACLLSTPASEVEHRLQDTLCGAAGGVFLPFTGGSLTIDMTQPQYSQFVNAAFTIQVAANQDANNANGDSFYNNVSVSTVTNNPPT